MATSQSEVLVSATISSSSSNNSFNILSDELVTKFCLLINPKDLAFVYSLNKRFNRIALPLYINALDTHTNANAEIRDYFLMLTNDQD